MKTLLDFGPVIVLLVILYTGADAQNVQQSPSMTGHPQHATEQWSGPVAGSGNRPAHDFGILPKSATERPLGDVARAEAKRKWLLRGIVVGFVFTDAQFSDKRAK